jgi:hypothetical protein
MGTSLGRLFQLLRLLTSRRNLVTLALVLALRLVWKARKEVRLVHDLRKVGRRLDDAEGEEREWDVIIVGGGESVAPSWGEKA